MRTEIIWKHTSAIFCDRLRSCDRDGRRSQTIAEDITMFYLLRSSAITSRQLRSSAIVCDRHQPVTHRDLKPENVLVTGITVVR